MRHMFSGGRARSTSLATSFATCPCNCKPVWFHPPLQVGVEDAMLRGRVRVTLRPLLYRVPVVGAIQAS